MNDKEPINAAETNNDDSVTRKPINTTLDPAVAEVFIRHLTCKQTNPSALLSEIVWTWANHPARSPAVLSLPPETSVLYQNESLSQYLTRTSVSVIEKMVEHQAGNFAAVARALQCDRSALHKRLERLKASTATQIYSVVFHRPPVLTNSEFASTSQLFPPLSIIKRKYINAVIEHCKGNKNEAAEVLGIPVTQLDLELADHSLKAVTNENAKKSPTTGRNKWQAKHRKSGKKTVSTT